MQLSCGPSRSSFGCWHCPALAVRAAASSVPPQQPTAISPVSRRLASLTACLLPLYLAAGPARADQPPQGQVVLPPGTSPYGNILKVPGDFLRARQRVNGGEKILAPIRASKRRLQEAEGVVARVNVYQPNPALYRDALNIIRTASLNCYNFEAVEGDSIELRASLLQRKLGVDACTFKLIARNVISLVPASKKKLKADTNIQLQDLIKSYELLDATLSNAWHGQAGAVEQVPQALQVTLAHTNSFETMIERCLELPPSNVAPSAMSALSLSRFMRVFGHEA